MTQGPSPLITRERLAMGFCVLVAAGLPAIMLMPHAIAIDDPQPQIVPAKLAVATMEPAGEALAKPMFNVDRRPPDLATAGDAATPDDIRAAEAAPPMPVGLITGHKIQGLALIRAADGQTAVARVGDIIDGWKVTLVAAGGVTFQKGAEERQVGLDYGNQPQGGGNPPPDPMPPASSHAGQ